MRWPTSLYMQTLLLLAGYVLTLAMLAVIAFNAQFGVGWNALMRGPLGERFNERIENLALKMASKPEESWQGFIHDFEQRYDCSLVVIDMRGDQVIGHAVLPPEVNKQIAVHTAFGRMFATHQFGKPFNKQPRHLPPPRFALEADHEVWLGRIIPIFTSKDFRPHPSIMLVHTKHIWLSGLLIDIPFAISVFATVFAVSLLFWLPFIYRITRRLEQLTLVTQKISHGSFDTQIAAGAPDEIGRLTQAINRMSSQLSRHLNGQKRMLGDIAHELVTPLARLEMAVEVAYETPHDERDSILNDIREEVAEMQQLTEELLAFAKAGLKGKDVSLSACRPADIMQEILHRLQCEARVNVLVDESVEVLADRVLLSRALSNLLRNSMRYAPSGMITVSVASGDREVRILVEDEGPGLPDEVIKYFGEPFLRAEASRTRDSGGFGLGLSIVKTCVEACSGSVTLSNRAAGGLLVTLTLSRIARDSEILPRDNSTKELATVP